MRRLLIVAAAGRGTRLGTDTPKVLVTVHGKPMLRHLLDLHAAWVDRAVVVAHPAAAARVEASARESSLPTEIVVQEPRTGMLDAVLIGARAAAAHSPSRVWITWGDQIGVHPQTLARLAEVERGSDVALPTVPRDAPYIHLARDASGRVTGILQRREGDEMPPAGESDMGLFSVSPRACFELLPLYAREAAPGAGTHERNFLPFIPWMTTRGVVTTCACTDPREAVGINTPDDLATVAAYLADR
jgi:bifunctional N-acetylglucosamine-1-phosphate-uridyltransferase/glucosamine-1-phosphate-acetyltransferase GlmU-like protein